MKPIRVANSLFRWMKSLFVRKNSLFRAEQRIYLQRTVIAAQMDARTRRKAPKWSEISKIPCYFPCCQGIGGILLPQIGLDLRALRDPPEERQRALDDAGHVLAPSL